LGQRMEIVGRENFALNDREEDPRWNRTGLFRFGDRAKCPYAAVWLFFGQQ
jgi:hypothetical protein